MQLSDYLLKLNRKEMDVLKLIAEGQRSKDVAESLRISRRTVEQRITRIIEKLDAKSQPHAVAIAIRVGIIA